MTLQGEDKYAKGGFDDVEENRGSSQLIMVQSKHHVEMAVQETSLIESVSFS